MEAKLPYIKAYTLAFCWGVFVLVMSLLPSSELPSSLIELDDFIIHGGVYFVFASFFFLAEYILNRLHRPRYAISLLVPFSYGVLVEIAQVTLTTYRTFSLMDILANGLGVVLAFLLFRFIALRKVKTA